MPAPKVSVIIPVYNVSQYIIQCVESALSQRFETEIILVNDGSSDSSGEICNDYGNYYRNVKVIHKMNGGLSSARNAGIEAAEGEYLFFLDGDDWIEKDALKNLYQLAEKADVDFIRFRLKDDNGNPVKYGQDRILNTGIYDREMVVKELFPVLICTDTLSLGPVIGVWRSLYRRSFLTENAMFFDEDIRYSEDIIFSTVLMSKTKRFYYTDDGIYYHYTNNPNSISRSFRKDRWPSNKGLYRKMKDYFLLYEGYDFSSQIDYLGAYLVMNSLTEFIKHNKKEVLNLAKDPSILDMLGFDLSSLNIDWKDRVKLKALRALASRQNIRGYGRE